MISDDFLNNQLKILIKAKKSGVFTFDTDQFNQFQFIGDVKYPSDNLAEDIWELVRKSDSPKNEYVFLNFSEKCTYIQTDNQIFSLYKEILSNGKEKIEFYHKSTPKKETVLSIQNQMTNVLKQIA